jgi:beta-mannosidase
VEPHSAVAVHASRLFTGFYDINYAYRFGPPSYDVVVARLVVGDVTVSEDVFLPLGHGRAREGDVGLSATWTATDRGPILRVSTQRFAQWVSVNVTGFRPSDSWFHLPPNSQRQVMLLGGDSARPPRGRVRSINSFTDATIRPSEDQ